MWNYTEEDLNNLMAVAFDYIRLNLPQNDIRDIFRKPSQNNGSIFSSKERWERFFEKHEANMESFQEKPVEEYTKDATGDDITPCLQARDAAWRKKRDVAASILCSKRNVWLRNWDSNTIFWISGKNLKIR